MGTLGFGDSWICGKNNSSGARSCQDRNGRAFGPFIGRVPAKHMQQPKSHRRHLAVSEPQTPRAQRPAQPAQPQRFPSACACGHLHRIGFIWISLFFFLFSRKPEAVQRIASGVTGPAVKKCTLVLPQRCANQSSHRHSGRPQHDTCGRRVCCTAPCPWEWNAQEWGVSVARTGS